MISHTVFRNRSNSIVLQLLSDEAPLVAPEDIKLVELALSSMANPELEQVVVDSASQLIGYDDEGVLTLVLGRVPEIGALVDGNYMVEVTGYGDGDDFGTAFGSFLIYLCDWGGEVNAS